MISPSSRAGSAEARREVRRRSPVAAFKRVDDLQPELVGAAGLNHTSAHWVSLETMSFARMTDPGPWLDPSNLHLSIRLNNPS